MQKLVYIFLPLFLFACIKDRYSPEPSPTTNSEPSGTVAIYTSSVYYSNWVYDFQGRKGVQLPYFKKEPVCDSFSRSPYGYHTSFTLTVGETYLLTLRNPTLDIFGTNQYTITKRIYMDTAGCRMIDIQ